VVIYGLPVETHEERIRTETETTLRGRVWKILLGVTHVDAKSYKDLVEKGPSFHDQTIVNDAERTFSNEVKFTDHATTDKTVRVLNAMQHFLNSLKNGEGYAQGMNIYAAAFLYCMPEVDAFFCLKKFMIDHCPMYMNLRHQRIPGVYQAVKLFGEVLGKFDPELAQHISKANIPLEALVMSTLHGLNVTLAPYDEWLKLWDFSLALGVHFHVIFAVARVILIREQLFSADSPNTFLAHKKWPELRASSIINLAMVILQSLSESLYDRLVRHTLGALPTTPRG